MEYLLNQSENVTEHTRDCTITKKSSLTKFGYFINKLWHFFSKHMF
jgi:hypothetical protein